MCAAKANTHRCRNQLNNSTELQCLCGQQGVPSPRNNNGALAGVIIPWEFSGHTLGVEANSESKSTELQQLCVKPNEPQWSIARGNKTPGILKAHTWCKGQLGKPEY